jgi:hypothetical protein
MPAIAHIHAMYVCMLSVQEAFCLVLYTRCAARRCAANLIVCGYMCKCADFELVVFAVLCSKLWRMVQVPVLIIIIAVLSAAAGWIVDWATQRLLLVR